MIYRSPLPMVYVPASTVPQHVLATAHLHGDRPAITDAATGETLTYAELSDEVRTTAAGLVESGIRPGDVVALISPNQPKFAIGLYAIMAAGATAALINPALTVQEITRLLELSNAKHTLDLTNLPRGTAELPRPDPTATAAILFSSGTTGLTKAVELSHRALVANVEQQRQGWRIDESDVLAANLPFFHILGFAIVLNCGLKGGAHLITMPRSDTATYLRRLEEHAVTRAFLVPPLAAAIAQEPPTGITSLKLVLCGAAPLDEQIRRAAEEKLNAPIRQGYGLTEAGGTHQTFDDDLDSDPTSIGVLSAGTEARIVEPGTTRDVSPGEPGELLLRGPQLMNGYLNDPEATGHALIEDGWLRTGDLVTATNDRFYVVDRIKEMIKYKGYQVAPAELEALLRKHPNVKDVAVAGVPDRANGEVPKAFVVTQGDVTANDLMEFVAGQVASYKKVRQVEFVNEIPKSVSGKILRRLLKDVPACAS